MEVAAYSTGGQKAKVKSFTTARRSRNQKQKPLHHGATESRRKTKDKWVRAGPLGFRCIQNRDFDISTSPRHQKMEYTELRLTHWVAAFPWPRFSDAYILGSKYRNLGFGYSEAPGGPARTHLSFVFLRDSVAPWCKGLVFGWASDLLAATPEPAGSTSLTYPWSLAWKTYRR